jgi:hypothetical protein
MSTFDDPNREALGLEPIWTGAGDDTPPADPPPDGEPEPEPKSRPVKPAASQPEPEPTGDHTDEVG